MRYVILGAGAIGGAIGGKLAQAGRDVVLVARGDHLAALRSGGLELRDPERTDHLTLPAAGSPQEAGIEPGDCVIVATKTQQSEAALDDLRRAAGRHKGEIAVVCAQNGVENERLALRRFEHVYAMRVILAGTHLEPGVVEIATAPVYGLLEVGRYPSGSDETVAEIVADLAAAGFGARVAEDVMSYKYLKLLSNLANALEAATGLRTGDEAAAELLDRARSEALSCFERAGIVLADEAEDAARRRLRGGARSVGGTLRHGGSSWQSLARGTGDIEADYLNGEIVLLGRLHGIPTPVNALLQEVANSLAESRRPPGGTEAKELLSMLEAQEPK